ncbi:cordon-bleu protein-like 1 isoform X3 [Aquarana catesbeiana]|uniref:cordon-bleu protein-like 1 isoform X3 n=1 Tax=Aquarana catesbeiana TaxID=8400 RepID=UPI003CC9DE19
MDDSGSWSETSSPDATLPSQGKKAKGKAPLPPGDTRYSDSLPSFDSAETFQFNMDQKENIDRDIELNVVLPGDRVTSTTVNGSKPMMDLLVFLCGQYHLNPSTYTIELLSADKNVLKFKPNTPVGMLEVEKVILKSKNVEDKQKKPGPTMPEQTVRVVINYKRTQKTVMRVSPFVPLQDHIPSICSKCEFDPETTVLLHDYQSQKPLDITKSLNDLGLRELYALDQNKATSPTEFKLPPLQESCQNVEMKQNDDKRFFNFFRRSTKKKRDQTSSAPATPLLNKPRPTHAVKANTVIKSYDSNTMPSDVPKKRRAPLPPMHPSQNNAIARGQIRTTSCVVKSVSVDESEKFVSGFDRSRTGSFQHSGTSSFNSSIKRAKRKAPPPPAPPCKPLQASDENSNIVRVSEEVNDAKVENDEKNLDGAAPEADVVLESEQQTVEEKNESSVSLKLEENTSLKKEATGSGKEEISISSAEEQSVETLVTDEIASSEMQCSMVSNVENISKISEDEIITESTSSPLSRDDTVMENTTLEYDKIVELENRTSTPTAELENHQIFTTKTVVLEQGSQTLSSEQHTKDTNIVFQDYRHITENETHEHLKSTNTEKGKMQDSAVQTMQDSAVQTVNFDNDAEKPSEEFLHSRESTYLTTVSSTDNVQHKLNGHIGQLTQFNGQQMAVTGKEPSKQELVDNLRENMHTQTIDESSVESSLISQSKTFPFYRQHSDPKPKPSNEITRDYLPKIGMTTYKIVPQRSFDVEQYMESESPQDVHNIECRPMNEHVISHTVTHGNNTSAVGEKDILLSQTKNGHHLPEGSATYSFNTASKSVSEPSQRDHLALSRSLSAAPALSTNKVAPEVKPKPKPTSPVKGPSSFYLQMQRRASSMYVTSAIAKTKTSTSAANSTAKPKDHSNEASLITITTLPSRINVVNMSSGLEERLPGDRSELSGRPYEVKNGGLGSINEVNLETENIYTSHSSMESHVKPIQSEVSSVSVPVEHKKHVTFQETIQTDDLEPPLQVKISDYTSTVPDIYRADRPAVPQDYKPEVLSTTSHSKLTRTLSSLTGQSAPLTLPKLSTFITPKPFTSTNSSSFSSTVTSPVKRSQSFSSSISPVKQPLNVIAPIGWSSVTSPVEFKKDSLVFPESSEEILENEITIRSNTISVNGKSRISHPAFSQTLPEN